MLAEYCSRRHVLYWNPVFLFFLRTAAAADRRGVVSLYSGPPAGLGSGVVGDQVQYVLPTFHHPSAQFAACRRPVSRRDRSNNNGTLEWFRWIERRQLQRGWWRRLVVADNWPFERQPVIYVCRPRHATLGFCRHFRHAQSTYTTTTSGLLSDVALSYVIHKSAILRQFSRRSVSRVNGPVRLPILWHTLNRSVIPRSCRQKFYLMQKTDDTESLIRFPCTHKFHTRMSTNVPQIIGNVWCCCIILRPADASCALNIMVAFLARDSIYAIARYMLSSVRPSVCLSVCHTGGSVEDGWR